jgi:hypothetical protein
MCCNAGLQVELLELSLAVKVQNKQSGKWSEPGNLGKFRKK